MLPRNGSIPRLPQRPVLPPTTSCTHAPSVDRYETRSQTVPVTLESPKPQSSAEFCPVSCHSDLKHVVRKTNQELVILDSSIWISVFLFWVSLFVAYRVMLQHNARSLLVDGV